jgi:hypothetical protein
MTSYEKWSFMSCLSRYSHALSHAGNAGTFFASNLSRHPTPICSCEPPANMRPAGPPNARPLQANSQLRNLPAGGKSPAPPPPPVPQAAPTNVVLPPKPPPGVSPRVSSSGGENAKSSSDASSKPPPPPPSIQAPNPAEKRKNVFKNRYLDEARDSARRMQLLDLVKVNHAHPMFFSNELIPHPTLKSFFTGEKKI